jgi:uncharacterized cofD-like protein
MSQFEDYPDITAIGGGHGLASVADALGTEYLDAHTTALSTVVDSGSATGRVGELLDELGAGRYGLGDLRNVLGRVSTNLGGEMFGKRFGEEDTLDTVAAMNADMAQMLTQRGLDESHVTGVMEGALNIADRLGNIRGHTYGNFVLGSLCIRQGLVSGVETANDWLQTRARVQTMTATPHHLGLYDNDQYYFTEAVVDDHKVEDPETARVELTPDAEITEEAFEAIAKADIVVIAPGSLWTSTLPALAVSGVAEAFRIQSQRPGTSRLIVANLVHEPNAGTMPLASYVRKIEELTEAQFAVIHNTNVDAIPARYEALCDGGELGDRGFGAKLVSTEDIKIDPNDPLAGTKQRSEAPLHDRPALATAIATAHRTVSSKSSYATLR